VVAHTADGRCALDSHGSALLLDLQQAGGLILAVAICRGGATLALGSHDRMGDKREERCEGNDPRHGENFD